jgi:predicted CXXCH cytochrome family protein
VTLAPLLLGGSWHQDEKLLCSDCHTMHNSAAGLALRYDGDLTPAPHLLRSASADALCLHCHGSIPAAGAPQVARAQGAQGGLATAGGFFTYLGGSGGEPVAGYGHVLGEASAADPATYLSSTSRTLSCLSCHDQHGSALYRNLRESPSGAAGASSPLVTERVLAGGGALDEIYGEANVRYLSGLSGWCQCCHDRYEHYHVDVTVGDDATVSSIWANAPLSSTGQPLPRLRVQTPIVATVPDPSNQLFCLSCHRAHGSSAPHGVIYPDPADANSLCAQCHGGSGATP